MTIAVRAFQHIFSLKIISASPAPSVTLVTVVRAGHVACLATMLMAQSRSAMSAVLTIYTLSMRLHNVRLVSWALSRRAVQNDLAQRVPHVLRDIVATVLANRPFVRAGIIHTLAKTPVLLVAPTTNFPSRDLLHAPHAGLGTTPKEAQSTHVPRVSHTKALATMACSFYKSCALKTTIAARATQATTC